MLDSDSLEAIPARGRSRHGAAASEATFEGDPTFVFLRALWDLNHELESASRAMKSRVGVTGPERLFVRVVGQAPGVSRRRPRCCSRSRSGSR